MIKKCEILLVNPHLNIIVVDFDGMKIQFTGVVDEGVKTAYVEYVDGIAKIVSKDEYEKSLRPKAVKKTKSVDATNKVVESEAVKNETDILSE